MARQILNNGETALQFRTKLNSNFEELYEGPIIAEGTPVNAEPAGFVATVNSRPDDYVKNVPSSITLTVATQPITNVQSTGTITVSDTPQVDIPNVYATGSMTIDTLPLVELTEIKATSTITVNTSPLEEIVNVDATGIITVTGTPVARVEEVTATGTIIVSDTPVGPVGDASATGVMTLSGFLPNLGETFVIGTQTFTWVESGTDTGNVVLGITPAECVANIVTSVNRDIAAQVGAVDASPDVNITATNAGTVGNAIIFTESSTGLAIVPTSGYLTGGTDTSSETITIDSEVYTFRPAKLFDFDIVISATTSVQATNIMTAIELDSLIVDAVINGVDDDQVDITSKATGAAGNVTFSETATGIAVAGLDNGVTYAKGETITVGTQEFEFVTLRSALPEITVDANNTTQATNIVDAITLDISNVTAESTDGVVTITSVANGTAGNLIALTEDATGIAVTGTIEDKLSGGIDARAVETITLDGEVYTFVAAAAVPFDVTIAADTTDQAHNIITAVNTDSTKFTADHLLNVATITSVLTGAEGNGKVISESTVGIDVTSPTANGVTARAAETFEFASETFTFVTTRGGANEVTIGENVNSCATNTTFAINTDTAHTAAVDGTTLNKVNLISTTAGVAGNDLTLTENAVGITLLPADGSLDGGVDHVAADYFQVHDQVFTFVTSGTATGNVVVDANNTTQAENIVTSVTRDLTEVIADNTDAVVTITAAEEVPYLGTGGDVIVLTELATGIAVSGTGTLENGVDADTLTLDSTEYTFIANGLTPSATEIAIGTTVNETAAAIAGCTPPETLSVIAETNTVIIDATAPGTDGDGITVTSDNTRITGAGVTSGGVDEVNSYITINDIDYIFANTEGDDPVLIYPACSKVASSVGASMEDIAALWVAALRLDTEIFSNASVTNDGAVVTANYKEGGGEVGTETTYINNLVVAGDITVTGVDEDNTFSGEVDGTPGYFGQMFTDGTNFYINTQTDLTVTNKYWKKVILGSL